MLNYRCFILFLILSTSLGFAQSPYEGEWQATVADSTYIINVQTDGDDFYANFRKKVISTNTLIYTSEIGPDFFALNASGVTSSLEKVSGLFDDIRFTGSTVQTLDFTFELVRDCRGCVLKAILHLEEMQGVRSPDYEPIRFPNDLTFIKQ
ncbi:MAG: hypothetical protein ABF274_08645 [Nonlabens sp.]|uniref:hypothetical protein n=1 Tax=Nonlabens sp. TaxID=1888209 RepID=UPI00321B0C06